MWSLGIVLAEVLVEDGLHLVDGPSAAVARRLGKPRLWGLLGITTFTIGMHSYVGATTTRAVLQALIGRDSAFVRTPKRGALVGPDRAASRGRPLEDRPRSGAPRRQPLPRIAPRFSKTCAR
jgi:hypothetical protein